MKIARKTFWLIFILILLLPFSRNWKLLLFGKRAVGEVVHHRKIPFRNSEVGAVDTYSVIEFSAGYETIQLLGPDNLIYPIGKKIKILYNPKDPTDCIPMDISAIYLGRYMIFPGILLFLWIAIYVSAKQTEHQNKNKLFKTRLNKEGPNHPVRRVQ